MAWTLVASGRGVDAVTLNTTGANFLIATLNSGVMTDIASWDNKNNNWIRLTNHEIGTYRHRIAYCINPSSVGTSHTITDPNSAIADHEIHFYAFTAPAGTVSFHSENGANDATFGGASTKSANYAGSMSVTPATNDALIFCGVGTVASSGSTSAYGVGSGFTLGLNLGAAANVPGGASAYLNQATAANVDPTISWTTSARWSSSIAVFQVAAGGGPLTRGLVGVSPLLRSRCIG